MDSAISFKFRVRELLRITLPMVVEHLSLSVIAMVSAMLVAGVGEHAISAMGMVDSVLNLIFALFAALTVGGVIVVSQYMGREDIVRAKAACGQAVLLATVFSLIVAGILLIFGAGILSALFPAAADDVAESARTFLVLVSLSFPALALRETIFGLLRGTGDTLTPMTISIVTNILNLLLGIALILGIDWWFIRISPMGVAGAGTALLISRTLGAIAGGWFVARRVKRIRLNRLSYLRPNFSMQKTIMRLGMPTSLESGLFNVGALIIQMLIVSMGTAAIATHAIGSNIMGFVNVPGNALATSLMILVGARIGRGEAEDVLPTARFVVFAGMGAFAVVCLGVFFMRGWLFGLFSPEPETLVYLNRVIIVALVASPLLWPSSFIAPAALRATGDVMHPMIVSIISMLGVRVVISLVLGVFMGWGILGVWLGMTADWLVRGICFWVRLIRGKWKGKAIA